MKIRKLKIVNYKLFQNVVIEMNDSMNIFVGENDSGKSTILEALSMVLTGRINGSSIMEALIKSQERSARGFVSKLRFGNRRNTLCISRFSNQ